MPTLWNLCLAVGENTEIEAYGTARETNVAKKRTPGVNSSFQTVPTGPHLRDRGNSSGSMMLTNLFKDVSARENPTRPINWENPEPTKTGNTEKGLDPH